MVNKALPFTLGIAVMLVFASEMHAVRVHSVTEKIQQKLKNINEYDKSQDSNHSFVYISTKNVLYSTLVDNDFNMQINAGYFKRNVEFCQWEETKTIEKVGDREIPRFSYQKIWANHQIDSNSFNETGYYFNPKIQTISDAHIRGKIKVGSYDISANLTNIGSTSRFIPSMPQIATFTTTMMQQQFRYIGNGVFYHEYQPGSTPLFNQYFGYGIVNGELPKDAMNMLFGNCNAGDVRVRFEYWAPAQLSVIGYREGDEIQMREFDGVNIGALAAGNVTSDALIEDHRSNSVFLLWFSRVVYIIVAYFAVTLSRGKRSLIPIFAGAFVIYLTNSEGVYKQFDTTESVFGGALVAGLISALAYTAIENGKEKAD